MKRKIFAQCLLALPLLSAPVFAAADATSGASSTAAGQTGESSSGEKGGHRNHPACRKIEKACKDAGFISGKWKEGDGLWRDCVDPIVQGVSTVPGATKPLPQVDAKIVAECKAHHPKFGEGKVGSPTPKAAKPAQ